MFLLLSCITETMGATFAVVGASVTCLVWWRDSKAHSVGLEKADVLNRVFTDPTAPIVRKPK